MFQYNVNTYAENEELTYRTNDPRKAIADFLESARHGAQTDIVNGCTGEVLVWANHPSGEQHCTDEMALMILGYLMEAEWGHAEAEEAECVDCEDEDSDLPTCGLCGGDVVDGVCNCCGRKVEPYVERIPNIGEVMVALAKQMADKLGVEVTSIPEGLPS